MSHSDERSNPFETVSDVEISRKEYYRTVLDTNVLAPLRILLNDPRGLFGFSTIVFFILVGTVGVWLTNPPDGTGGVLLSPFQNMEYPLGTDRYGNDLMLGLIHATPFMLLMIAGGALYNISVATIVGTFAGYKGGRIDEILMMICDAIIAVPGLPLVIVIAVIFEPTNPFVVGIVITLPRWAGLARALRSEVLSVRQESYIEASRTMGIPTRTILRHEIVPNLMPYIMINLVNAARGVIFASVGLYFLGILSVSTQNWGVMMNLAYTAAGSLYTWQSAHWLILPMICVVWLSFGLIMFGQAADKVFNPRLRARHAETVDEEAR
ncbi:ABC transporter permease [Halosolutus gelatinilyticus]|uniref:ABC transporter permease n=1 Tax=Halosolutus gelatinilyticus TaxID=2931975 RepID=UPI001FF46CD7|nr:ABC transporter permease [Halosolutus gelatinilyticus]